MNYLRSALTILIASLSLTMFGQTQTAFVKTRGRMVNGVHVPGQGLKGATVDIQDGNTYLVQNEDGSFSFPVPSQSFAVKSVHKKDYELIDQDFLKRSHRYSTNPLYIVMEKPEQQEQDLLESERNIRRTMRIEIQKREDELDSLKEAHKITTQEYQAALQKLYAAQSDNEKLISEMARQYAQIDYDQMTELNRQIHDAISNGRLSQADSLIHAKGSIQSRIEKVKHEEQILKEREQEIEEAKREYDDAKAGTIKEKEEIEDHCLTLKDRFMLELNVDSAAYYMELLVNLDSTDVYYLAGTGSFYHGIYNYEKAEYYFKRALDICMQSVDDYAYEICAIKVNLADIYCYYKDYSKAELLHKEALETIRRAGGEIESKKKEKKIDEIVSQMGLAGFYMTSKQYSKADSLLLSIVELLQEGYYDYDYDFETKKECLSAIYWQLGMNYLNLEEFEKADSLLMESVNIYREMAQRDSSYFESTAIPLFFLGFIKTYRQGLYYESEPLLLEALDDINKTSDKDDEINTAQIQACLGKVYKSTERPLESEKWYKEALPVLRQYAQAMPEQCNKYLSNPLVEYAELCQTMGRIDESETLYEEALKVVSYLALTDPETYSQTIPYIEDNLALIKYLHNQYHEADSLFDSALIKYKRLAEKEQVFDSIVITIQLKLYSLNSEMGEMYYEAQDYSESETCFLKALDITTQLCAKDPDKYEPDLCIVLEQIAGLYWNTQRYQEAEAMCDRCLDIIKNMLNKDPDYQLAYTNFVYRLSQLYPEIKNYNAAYKVGKEWIPILKKQSEEYPDLMLKDYAEGLGKQSFYAIFQTQYDESEQLAREGLETDSTLHWIAANLASALLLQGKYKEAEKICRQYKDELKDTFLDNFSEFEQAGVIPKKREKDVEKIKKLLTQPDN